VLQAAYDLGSTSVNNRPACRCAACLQYVLPTDVPHLAAQGTRLRTVMTPVLWTQHRPDCFDTYSAGVVLMQLR